MQKLLEIFGVSKRDEPMDVENSYSENPVDTHSDGDDISSNLGMKTIVSSLSIFLKGVTCELSREWHSHEHSTTREIMVTLIAFLIQKRRPSMSSIYFEKMIEICKKIEMQLYSSATSFDEYKNAETVVQRLSAMMIALVNQIDVLVRHGVLQTYEDTGLSIDARDDFFNENSGNEYPAGGRKVPLESVAARGAHSSSSLYYQADGSQRGYQVSSQGCSRVFIIKVLLRVSDYVRGKHLPSIFTFRRSWSWAG